MTRSSTDAVDSNPLPVLSGTAEQSPAKADVAGTGGRALSRVDTATPCNSSRFESVVAGPSSQPAADLQKTGGHGVVQVENIRPAPNGARTVGNARSSIQRETAPDRGRPRSTKRATHVGAFTPPVRMFTPSPRATATAPTATATTASTVTTTTTTSNAIITTTKAATSHVSIPDVPATPQAAKAMRQLDALTLQIPHTIQKRAKQRDDLFAALPTRDPLKIAKAMDAFPSDATLASYLPVANPEHFQHAWLKAAREYAKSIPDEALLDYLKWCEIQHHQMLVNDLSVKSDPGLRACFNPKVMALCMMMRRLDEKGDAANLALSANAILQLLLDAPVTARAMAEQTRASTRMMLQKCALLQAHAGEKSEAFSAFRKTLEKAHKVRKASHAGLQDALLGRIFHESAVVNMATSAYARAMTIPTVGYLRPDTTPVQLKTMQAAVEKLLRSPTLNPLQVAALTHVRESILTLAHLHH